LRIIGKGNKSRDIPIPDDLLTEFQDFRRFLGLSPYPLFNEKTPLIPQDNLTKAICLRHCSLQIKWGFISAADEMQLTDERRASKMRLVSAHWLRHAYVTSLLDFGVPMKVVQENAGHSNVATTMHYCHVSDKGRHDATRKLSI